MNRQQRGRKAVFLKQDRVNEAEKRKADPEPMDIACRHLLVAVGITASNRLIHKLTSIS